MAPLNPVRSLMMHMVDRLADRLTRDAPNRDQAYLAMVATICSVFAEACGGEWVYVPRTNAIERDIVRERIAQALDAGETPTQIARREGVSRELASKVKRRLRGTIGP